MCKAPHLSLNSQKRVIKKRCRVTFARGNDDLEVKTRIKFIQPISNEDSHNVYYSRVEKAQMKEDAKDVAHAVYGNENVAPFSSIMLRAFTSCHNDDLTEKERRFMIQWTAADHCLRGMEKIAVKGLSKKISDSKRTAIESVIEAHAVAMANHGYLSKATQEEISENYRKLASPFTKYAALKAKVDEEALKVLERPKKKQRRRCLPRARCEPLGSLDQFWGAQA